MLTILDSSMPEGTRTGIIVLQLLYGLFFIIGIFENILVFHEIKKNKGRRNLTANKVLMLHLTLAELLILITFTPALFYVDFDVEYSTMIGCRVIVPMITFYPFLRVSTQVVIAIERRRAIVTPFKTRFSKRAVAVMLSLSWLLSAVLTVPVMLKAPTVGPLSCSEDKNQSKNYRIAFYTLRTAISLIIPLVIIAACYIQAALVLRKSRFCVLKDLSETSTYQREASRQQHVRVCKAFSIMVAVFAFSTGPLNVICIWVAFGSGRSKPLEDQALLCLVANFPLLFTSFLDPIVYGAYCRHGFWLKKVWCGIMHWKRNSFTLSDKE